MNVYSFICSSACYVFVRPNRNPIRMFKCAPVICDWLMVVLHSGTVAYLVSRFAVRSPCFAAPFARGDIAISAALRMFVLMVGVVFVYA